jgi:hypothetical protein
MRVKVALRNVEGKKVGEVDLADAMFGIEPNRHAIHQVVRMQRATARAGTASTKTRREVRGGGSKPWLQKGTGRARAGSTRSPIWRGGGVTFGPKPREYGFRVPKKVRRLAFLSALSAAARDERRRVNPAQAPSDTSQRLDRAQDQNPDPPPSRGQHEGANEPQENQGVHQRQLAASQGEPADGQRYEHGDER